MPKIVDHDLRREEIVDATWRLIERGGFERATMREIAAEAGFAHGALQRYFHDKEALLAAAFVRAHTRTNVRAADKLGDLRGLEALRTLCYEILPLSPERVQEARVVVAFWDRAVQDDNLWQAHRANALAWRAQMEGFLREAQDDGEVPTDLDVETVVDQISTMNAGHQVMCLLMPETTTPERQLRAVDTLIDGLRTSAHQTAVAHPVTA